MGIEIERKFLLKNNDWQAIANEGVNIQQGFLNRDKERTVRVRVIGNQGKLTVKGKTVNASRLEFEYDIPFLEANELIKLCESPIIQKTRFEVLHNSNLWEIDVFEGDLKGLVVAEIELEAENQTFEIPEWIGVEVTNDSRYYNSNLKVFPFPK